MNKLVTLMSHFLYGKYRDDCFATWNGSEQRLKQFP